MAAMPTAPFCTQAAAFFSGDAAEGEHRRGLGEVDGGAQGGESLAAGVSLLGDLLEDGREKEHGGAGCLTDFVGIMTGGADDGLEIGAGVDLLCGSDCRGSGIRVQVDAIGSDVEGQLRGTIDEDAGFSLRGADFLDDASGEELKLGEGQVSFTELDGIDPTARPLAGECDQSVALCGFVPGQQAAVRDGVEEHQKFQCKGGFTRPVINGL